MATKRFTLSALFGAVKRLRRGRAGAVAHCERMGARFAPPGTSLNESALGATGASLSYQALDDVYWVLRGEIGFSLDERLQHYRERLLRRRVEPSSVETRIAEIRPFLAAAVGVEDDRAEGGRPLLSYPSDAMRHRPAPSLAVEFVRLEGAQTAAYSEPAMGTTIRYTTDGPLRRRCGHQHKTLQSAVRCLEEDDAWCRDRGGGGHTDRRILVILGAGKRRELNDAERTAVEAYKAAHKPQE